MFRSRSRKPRMTDKLLPLAFGATAGLAAGLLLLRKAGSERPTDRGRSDVALIDLEERIVDRLVRDPVLGRRAIDVAALTPGIVELTGSVEDEDESDRAVRVAREVGGVRTVLNRLDVASLEEHLADTRERLREGDPALTETHWYGMEVGMGRRRQGRSTEPTQPDDRNKIMERELGVAYALEQASEPLDKVGPAVEGHTSSLAAPTSYGSVDATSHRSLGNEDARPESEFGPGEVTDTAKEGTELTIEQADGASDEVKRDLND